MAIGPAPLFSYGDTSNAVGGMRIAPKSGPCVGKGRLNPQSACYGLFI